MDDYLGFSGGDNLQCLLDDRFPLEMINLLVSSILLSTPRRGFEKNS